MGAYKYHGKAIKYTGHEGKLTCWGFGSIACYARKLHCDIQIEVEQARQLHSISHRKLTYQIRSAGFVILADRVEPLPHYGEPSYGREDIDTK